MKIILPKLMITLKETLLSLLVIFLIMHTCVFNVIDIFPSLYQIDITKIKYKLDNFISAAEDFFLPDCQAASFDFQPPDKAAFEGFKGANLSGSFQADLFTGRASFVYPIGVPPGRKGLQPNLNLAYSSSNNNGTCGVGWGIDLGSIYRSTKKGIPKYDNSDLFIFSINGSESELVNVGGNEYRAKVENDFMRLYFNGSYWEITDKSGTKYRLGYNSDSKVSNIKGIHKWSLDKVTDVFGNYMTVSYLSDQGQLYLAQIKYTGNETSGDLPRFSVDFTNEARQDIPPVYRTGDRAITAYRLKEIQARVDGALAKKYVLDYTYSSESRRSLLSSITQYGSDGITSFPPVRFSYKTNGYSIGSGSSWLNGFSGTWPLLGDFNGDGLSDVGLNFKTRDTIALANGTGFNPPSDWLNFSHEWSGNSAFSWAGFSGDFNGDGITDLAGAASYLLCRGGGCSWPPGTGTGLWYYNNRLEVALSSGTSFNTPAVWFPAEETSFFIWGKKVLTGDFNGDGLTDVMECYLYNSGSNAKYRTFLSSGSGFVDNGYWMQGLNTSDTFLTGDFNADGVSDFGVVDSGGTWQIALSTASSFNPFSTWISGFGGSGKKPIAIDVNNDGLTDAVSFDSNIGQWQAAISDGKNFIASGDWMSNFGAGKFPLAGDYSGSGIAGPASFDAALGSWQIANIQGTPDDLLSQVDNGIGGSTAIDYTASAHNTNLPFVIQTVKSVTVNDGLGNSYSTNYQYAGGFYDRQDKEFRGFNYVKVIDTEGNSTETYFKQDDIYKGRPYLQQTKDALGNLYSKQENTWNYAEVKPGVYFVYLKQQDNFIYDGDLTFKHTRAEYEFDSYGNTKRIYTYGDVDKTGDEKDVRMEYAYNSVDWIVSLFSHTYVLDPQGTKAQEKWFYYDNHPNIMDSPTKGLVTKEELWLNTETQNLITTHTYDVYGNPVSTSDIKGEASSITHDTTYHIYPNILTNALGQSVRQSYDPKTGEVLSTTDANNQTTTNIYDALGRIIKVVGPNDSPDLPFTLYEYDLSKCPTKITEKSKINAQGQYLTVYSFSDGLGRDIQTKTPAEDDPQTYLARQVVSGIVKYDAKGQIKEKYFPYFVQDSPSYVTPDYTSPKISFSYDVIGRITQVTNPDGTYSTTSYSDWSVTETDENGHYKTEYYDAYQRLIKVEEHNQGQTFTTTYEYDIEDNLTKTIDNQGNVTQIWYDSLGRKIKMDDPDAGIWSYEYDILGNLIKQTDAKGQMLEFEYDSLNRLTRKLTSSQTLASYLYDDTAKPNCIGRLSKITDSSGVTEFFYDNLGREIKNIKTMDGNSFTLEQTYDSLDRVTSLKYPDGEIVNYTFDKSGSIETISGAANYVMAVEYLAAGQIKRITYGNGTHTDYAYDPNTLRLSNLMTNDGSLQNLSYTFDNAGNIKNIVDRVNTATQSFIYDDLNRLTDASGNYGSRHYRYDSIGNMLEKEGVTYAYGSSGKKPYAATWGSNGFSGSYDANGNMVSKGNTLLSYDYDNRLTKVESGSSGVEITLSINLGQGWNFISLPVKPSNATVTSVLSSLQFGSDYNQVSRYNPNTKKFEHFVNDGTFDEFSTMEYGRGYQIYVTNLSGCTLVVKGYLPLQEENIGLLAGWNLVFSPYLMEKPVADTLTPLVFGSDYDQVSRYNNFLQEFEHSRNRADDTLHSMKPHEGYYLYCLKDATWRVPAQTSITEFVYDAEGDRVKKITSSETTLYLGSLYEKTGSKSTNHIFFGDNRIASRESTGNTYYYHQDHLGSSNVVTDQNGNQTQLLEYTPFGTPWVNQGIDVAKYKFTGKELDNTGFYYFGARYYDPEIGRFIQPDDYVQDLSDPQSFNRYTYCRNNPLIYTDPSGNNPLAVFFAVLSIISIAAAAVSVVASLAAQRTGSQTWANIARIAGLISFATGAISALGNSIVASTASQSTQLASASESVDLGVIEVYSKSATAQAYQNAVTAQNAAGFAQQSAVASVAGGVTSIFVDTATISGGIEVIRGANYGTIRGWLEGGVGVISVGASIADAGFNVATGGVKGAGKTAVKALGQKAKKIVIGEGFGRALRPGELDRVARKALKIGAEYYNPRKGVSEIGIKNAMRNNYQWLRRKIAQGYEVVDIGEYGGRSSRGIFYEAEKRWLRLWGKL